MSAANRRVLAEIQRWAVAYRGGDVPTRFVRPPLHHGERLAVGIFPVLLSEQPGERPFEQWVPRPGARSLRFPFRDDGHLYATSRRLYLVRDREVHREWSWGEVRSLDLVPNWRGLAMRLGQDSDRIHVIGNVFHTFVLRPGPVTLAAAWLKVQGAWSEWRGPEEFTAWTRLVARRLGPPGVGLTGLG